ncbi:ankyrin repeat-containing domain protein, partial [Tuber borchii]
LIIARRPLSIKEATIALGLSSAHSSLEMLQDDIDRDMRADKLRKLCGPLIHVDESIGRVTLLHYSVKEYLIDRAGAHPNIWWRITLQDASKQIARDCITFLSFHEFSSSVPHPHDHYRPYTYDTPPAFVCYFGLEALVPLVARSATTGSQDSAEPEQGFSPLKMSALGGHLRVVKKLLELPQHASDSQDGKAALSVAVDRGHTHIVECLLQHFPSLDSLSPELESASVGGHTEIAKLLLERGTDINQGIEYSCPLDAAAYYGHLDMVKLLIERDADINCSSNSSVYGHGAALHSAAVSNHLEVVEELLRSGANPNLICEPHGTALQAAAHSGCLDVVETLLKVTREPNRQCGQYGSALEAARFVGHDDIAQLLGDTG